MSTGFHRGVRFIRSLFVAFMDTRDKWFMWGTRRGIWGAIRLTGWWCMERGIGISRGIGSSMCRGRARLVLRRNIIRIRDDGDSALGWRLAAGRLGSQLRKNRTRMVDGLGTAG